MRVLLFLLLVIGIFNISYSQTQKYLDGNGKQLHYCTDHQIDSAIDASILVYSNKISDSKFDNKKFEKYLNSVKKGFNKKVWDEVLYRADVVPGKESIATKKGKAKEFGKLTKHIARATIKVMDDLKSAFEADLAADKIQSFHADFEIRKDGSMRVVETIAVLNTETGSINKGIVRYIPDSYDIGLGLNFKMIVRVDSILFNNQPVKYDEGFEAGSKLLYIGNPDSILSFGSHVYKIIYTVKRPFKYGEGYDELYWNVNGNGWEFDIDSISCVVKFPEGTTVNSFSCYTGKYGDSAKDCFGKFDAKTSSLVFAANGGLLKNEGLTIACSIPEGIITREPEWSIIMFSNSGPFFMIWVAILLLIRNLVILGWRKLKASNKNKANIVPEFTAPDDVNPALAGYIYHKGYEPSQTIASLVNLAVNKYLTISADSSGSGNYLIAATDKKVPFGKEAEQLLIEDAEIIVTGHIKPDKASEEVAYFDAQVKRYCDSKNKNAALFVYKRGGQIWGRVLIGVSLAISVLLMTIHYKPSALTFVYYLTGIVLCALVHKLLDLRYTKYTQAGETLLNKILGLRMFLATADSQRMNTINKPNADFVPEKMLPYAIALDCLQEWTSAFGNSIKKSLEADGFAENTMVNSVVYSTGGYYLLSNSMRRSWGVDYSNFYQRRLTEITEELNSNTTESEEKRRPDLTIFRHSSDRAAAEMLSRRTEEFKQLVDYKKKEIEAEALRASESNSSKSSVSKSTNSGSASKGSGYSGGGRGGGGGGGW